MSIILESYERDFDKSTQLSNKMINNFHLNEESQKELILTQIKKYLTDADNNLKKMEMENALLQNQSKNTLQNKIKKYRSDFQELKTKFMKMENNYLEKKSKEALLGNRSEENIKKNKLISNTEKVLNQKDQFNTMNQVANETENAAIGITQNLQTQREMILKAGTLTKETYNDLNRTDRVIAMMRNREIFNKIILIVLIIILTIANFILLYVRVSSL